MNIMQSIRAAEELYRQGDVIAATEALRRIADRIEREKAEDDAYRFDADGWADHMRSMVEDFPGGE